ncbi:nucleotidyltransferase family protein [Sphaerospermopsis aphanizomenoides BCCUSP55]|uniref:nucleotidyltransferase family protein n=1 Tax=Sphaerospermopsis aphanizomenoides TaxID=459663 RepID=UPI001904CFFA|nr:nucleotidyltransferase family protein [Sphaerospermopsis aphanizomenoides]MBK1989948.1 nucleotidyltransferase family protein [Sphaerospermopsis aphanizomenoides BCCUSP55]
MTESNIGIIILAAGASTRMGTPKQLLPYQGKSLLSHTIESAIASVCNPVILVLGANAENIRSQISTPTIKIVENPDWHLGMSASIRCGIVSLIDNYPTLDAAVITVCDQPFLAHEIINQLVTAYHTSKKTIIACEYADTLGVPVLFSQIFFSELAGLSEDVGAKKLIKTYSKDVFSIPFPSGAIDIDTPQDYQKLQES